MFYKKGVLKNFTKFTGKFLYQGLFFKKVAGLACKFIKKETLAQVLSREFYEIFKNPSGQLLLYPDNFYYFINCLEINPVTIYVIVS